MINRPTLNERPPPLEKRVTVALADSDAHSTELFALIAETMTAIDTAEATASEERARAFVDGSGNPLDLTAGNRPRYRIPTADSYNFSRQLIADSRECADRATPNAWRLHDGEIACADSDGPGRDEDGTTCDTCGGYGIVSNHCETVEQASANTSPHHEGKSCRRDDARTFQKTHDHREAMYRQYDAWLEQQWRMK